MTSNPTPGQFHRNLEVAQIGTNPANLPLTVDLTVSQERITREVPGQVVLTVTNDGNSPRQIGRPFYKGASVEHGPQGILLISVDAPEARSIDLACTGDGKTRENLARTEEYPIPSTIDSGEAVVYEFLVIDDPTHPGCLPPNRYRFTNTFTVEGGPDGGTDLTFELRITDPNCSADTL
ncbi:hypothetical protein [Haloarchaeobius amylolyticus]|uniref:hypothetical protein n=1 Tax=Haloarchaeobius amylolyticus TaxID=1198296 RepID=UPI00226F35EE|nr:hypothetical protein [Haloarchaeobius amylolyticus]